MKKKLEPCPSTLHPHPSSVGLHDASHDGQAQTGASFSSGRAHAGPTEFGEELRHLVRGNPLTLVPNVDGQFPGVELDHQIDGASRGRVLHRVGEEVGHHLTDADGVGPHFQLRIGNIYPQGYVLHGEKGLDRLHLLPHHLR